MPAELFEKVVREVESLFFVYVACRENTRDFERNFAAWAPELRAVNDESQLDHFLTNRIEKSKSALSSRFEESFRRLSSGDLQVYRLRYILAKLNQHIEISAFGATEGTKWLKNFIANEFQIEHIQPRNPRADAAEEFGELINPHSIERLGNLVLVEKQINGSLGNKPFSQKKPVYPKSKLLLVHAISERPKIGLNTSVDRAVCGLNPYSDWNETNIVARQRMLYELATEIWNIPAQMLPKQQEIDGAAG